jgi:hypothetical protein
VLIYAFCCSAVVYSLIVLTITHIKTPSVNLFTYRITFFHLIMSLKSLAAVLTLGGASAAEFVFQEGTQATMVTGVGEDKCIIL